MILIASINSEIRPDCCRFTLSVSCGIACCYWSVLFRVQRDTFYQESLLMQGSWFSASFAYWTSQSTELETMQFPLGIIQLFFNRFVARTFFFLSFFEVMFSSVQCFFISTPLRTRPFIMLPEKGQKVKTHDCTAHLKHPWARESWSKISIWLSFPK